MPLGVSERTTQKAPPPRSMESLHMVQSHKSGETRLLCVCPIVLLTLLLHDTPLLNCLGIKTVFWVKAADESIP